LNVIQQVMVVLQPLKVQLTGREFEQHNVVSIPEGENNRELQMESEVYIDRSDFRLEDSEDYFGLAPGKVVGLKYAFRVRCESVESDGSGAPVLLRCVALPDSDLAEDKPTGSIQWVPASAAVPIEARLYSASSGDQTNTSEMGWRQEIAGDVEHVFLTALAEAHLSELTSSSSKHVMFDGIGYFAPINVSSAGDAQFAQTISLGNNDRYLVSEVDDASIRQRTAKARAEAEKEKAAKLNAYLESDSGELSPKPSVVERAELARQNAEQETQARIEQMKQAKRDEMQHNNKAGGGSMRLELARLEEEQATQEKLERLRKEKMSEFVTRQASGNVGEEALTPKQRQEEVRRRAEQEKQERLAEFLSKDKAEGEDDLNASTVSVKERYERAKQLQQQQEEERLESLRSSPVRNGRRGSVRDAWSSALQGSAKSVKAEDSAKESVTAPDSGKGSSRAKSMWAEALNEQKQTQEQRVNQTKKQTIAQFRLTDGTGLVKKRIGEWEELFMELAASVEQLEQTLAAARELSEASYWGHDISELHRLQKEFRDSAEVPEPFELGSTKIYNIKLLDHHIAAYIKRSLQDVKTKHFALSCGVYGDQDGGKPPIDLYAAAIKTDDKTMYIALTIKPTPGSELDPRAYGIKKVAVFSKDVNQKMLERLVDVVPQKGWEGWVARGTYGDGDMCSPAQTGEGTELDGSTAGGTGARVSESEGHDGANPSANLGIAMLEEAGAGAEPETEAQPAEGESTLPAPDEARPEDDRHSHDAGEAHSAWRDVPTTTHEVGGTGAGEDSTQDATAFADVSTPRESQLGHVAATGQAQAGMDGSDNPFFDDDGAGEDEEAESDVGETWKIKDTPQPKSPHGPKGQ
jgi:hypothetical protein